MTPQTPLHVEDGMKRPGPASHLLCQLLSAEQTLTEQDRHVLLQSKTIWPEILSLASSELLLPQLHGAITKKNILLSDLDEELVSFLAAAIQLNQERNEQLRSQISSIAEILSPLHQPIILLKGAAYLYGLPENAWHTRMIGDIDLLLPNDILYDAVALLHASGYSPLDGNWYYDHRRTNHYPPLAHPKRIALVELHEFPCAREINPPLTFGEFLHSAIQISSLTENCFIPSPTLRVLHNILHAQFGERGYYSTKYQFRELHDFCVLSTMPNIDWPRIISQFPSRRYRSIFLDYLQQARTLFKWKPPEEVRSLLDSTDNYHTISQNKVDLPSKRSILATYILAMAGAFSPERLQAHYGHTRSTLQICGYVVKRFGEVALKCAQREGRHALARIVKQGSVQTIISHVADEVPSEIKDFDILELDASWLLFHRQNGRGYLLNHSAAMIATDLIQGIPRETIAHEIVTQAHIEKVRALEDVSRVERLFVQASSESQEEPQRGTLPYWHELCKISASFPSTEIQIRDCLFQIRYHPHLATAVHYCKSRIEAATLDLLEPQSKHELIASINERGTELMADDVITFSHQNSATAPSLLFSQLQRLAASHTEHAIALHGAACHIGNATILLLGLSGSGKSTLLAALAQNGAQVIADDLLLLTPGLTAVYRLPIPIGIKSDTADPERFPFVHPNGRAVGYQALNPLAEGAYGPITAIFFPHYQFGRSTALATTLSRGETLLAMSQAGFYGPSRDYGVLFRQFSDLLTRIPVVSLQYGRTEDALQLIWQNCDFDNRGG